MIKQKHIQTVMASDIKRGYHVSLFELIYFFPQSIPLQRYGDKILPILCQFNGPKSFLAQNQLHTQLCFQGWQPMADRWLTDIKKICCPGYTSYFHNSQESCNLILCHFSVLSAWVFCQLPHQVIWIIQDLIIICKVKRYINVKLSYRDFRYFISLTLL